MIVDGCNVNFCILGKYIALKVAAPSGAKCHAQLLPVDALRPNILKVQCQSSTP